MILMVNLNREVKNKYIFKYILFKNKKNVFSQVRLQKSFLKNRCHYYGFFKHLFMSGYGLNYLKH